MSSGGIFSCLALLVQIVAFAVCGVIRYFHMCPPFGDNEQYYYPSRKWVTFFYLLPLLELPYIVNPLAPDAWILVKAFNIIYIPTLASTLIRSYFLNRKKVARHGFLCIGVLVLLCLSLFACIRESILSEHKRLLSIGIMTLAGVMMIYLAVTMMWLRKIINAIIQGEYSDDESFPVPFAKRVLPEIAILVLLAIAVYFLDSPVAFGIFCIFFAIIGVSFLLAILSPQRHGEIPVVTDIKESVSEINLLESAEEVLKKENALLSEETLDKLEAQVRDHVCGKRMFLDPKLNKTELSQAIGTNRTYLTTVFTERLGSFYNFINTQRLEYSREYIKSHPNASKQEIALNSGFGSVKSYNRAKERLGY